MFLPGKASSIGRFLGKESKWIQQHQETVATRVDNVYSLRGGSSLERSARCYKKEPRGRKRQVGGQVETWASGSMLVRAPTGYNKMLVYLPLTRRCQRSLAQVIDLEALIRRRFG